MHLGADLREQHLVHHRFTALFGGRPSNNGGKSLKKIKFNGTRRKGTLYPRRIWRPGEVYVVEDEVATELEEDPDFIILGKKGGKA
jgi:hypothetical protein